MTCSAISLTVRNLRITASSPRSFAIFPFFLYYFITFYCVLHLYALPHASGNISVAYRTFPNRRLLPEEYRIIWHIFINLW